MAALSGDDFEIALKNLTKRVRADMEHFTGSLMRSGRPPGTRMLDERGQYERLVKLSIQRDPRVVANPEAMAELERLSTKYGTPKGPVLPQTPRGL